MGIRINLEEILFEESLWRSFLSPPLQYTIFVYICGFLRWHAFSSSLSFRRTTILWKSSLGFSLSKSLSIASACLSTDRALFPTPVTSVRFHYTSFPLIWCHWILGPSMTRHITRSMRFVTRHDITHTLIYYFILIGNYFKWLPRKQLEENANINFGKILFNTKVYFNY